MKTTNIFKIVALSAVTLVMASCGDEFLDQDPDERVTIETEDQILSFLATGYADANYGWICELSSDNMIDNNSPHLPASDRVAQVEGYYNLSSYERMDDEIFRFDAVKSSTGSDSPSSIWSSFYQAIANNNHALMYIDQISAKTGMTPKLKAARAEALVARAYHHFILVNLFSQAYKDSIASLKDVGIPYIVDPEKKVYVHADRGSVTETYAKIQKDLEEGLKDLTDAYYDFPKWRFNVNAAHAFAARFYLYKREYQKVIEHANYVLGTERSENLLNMLMDYKNFDDCTNSSDYTLVWQSPERNNNLMLLATYSRSWRRFAGYRYAINSLPMRAINYRTGPTWHWTINCAGSVSGATFYRGNSDYGYIWCKAGESFEYTNKVAGIGYAHVIRREFTCNSLLLERAEAELMLGNKENCFQDLYWFEQSRQNFSDANKTKYLSGGSGLEPLTKAMIETSFFNKKSNLNCDFDWSSTQRMSASYVIPADAEPYMNCINDYRRWETAYEGYRFFDLKRWGIEYSHVVGYNKDVYTLTWNDPRRALEVPQEAIGAGLEPSRPAATSNGDGAATMATNLMFPTNK